MDHDNSKEITYKLKFIDSYRFMSSSLSSLIDNLSEINNKKLEDEFIDNIRSMITSSLHSLVNLSEINKKIEKSENKSNGNFRSIQNSLSNLVNDLSEINKQEPADEFIDAFRSMSTLLSHLVNYLSVINSKKIELENKFIDNFRTMLASRSHSADEIYEIDKKISLIELSEKFPNTHQLCNKDLNKFPLLLRKGVYPYGDMDSWEKLNKATLSPKEALYNELNK